MKIRRLLLIAVPDSEALLTGFPTLKTKADPLTLLTTEVSKLTGKKTRYYSAPGYNKPLFKRAHGIVEIETDGGIIGIGEGRSKEMIEQCAQMMIGRTPFGMNISGN
jgi:galactonate dehydratase